MAVSHVDPDIEEMVWDSLAITLQFLIITLQIPPSSASSEQLFSSTGDIISEEKTG